MWSVKKVAPSKPIRPYKNIWALHEMPRAKIRIESFVSTVKKAEQIESKRSLKLWNRSQSATILKDKISSPGSINNTFMWRTEKL